MSDIAPPATPGTTEQALGRSWPSGDLVADVEAIPRIADEGRREAAHHAFLSFYDTRMGRDTPLGAEDPGGWRDVYAWRCWYVSIDLLMWRNKGLISSSQVYEAIGINRDTVSLVRSDHFSDAKKRGFRSWRVVTPYLRAYLPEADLGPWQTLHGIASAYFSGVMASVEPLPPRRERLDKPLQKPPELPGAPETPHTESVRSSQLRRQTATIDEDIRAGYQSGQPTSVPSNAGPEGGELLESGSAHGLVQPEDTPNPRSGRSASHLTRRRLTVGLGALVLAGVAVLAALLLNSSTGNSPCHQAPIGRTTIRFPASYTGPIYVTVCAPASTPETVSLHLVWGPNHQFVELGDVTNRGRTVTTTKGGGSWPLTITLAPSAGLAWGTGQVTGAVDINSHWTR